MKKTWVVVSVVIVGLIAGVWWWRHRGHAGEAPSIVANHRGSAAIAARGTGVSQELAHAVVSVTDPNGPVAGAAVRIADEDGEVIVAKTGADGIARTDLAPGTWRFGASAAGHEPAAAPSRELQAAETAQIAIHLALGGASLAGMVTDASGGPVVGARIDAAKLGALARPSEAVATTITGADGHYKLAVAAGQLLVAVSHADYAPQTRDVEVSSAGATADFKLVPGGVIEGIVREEKTRQPVADAIVDATRDAPSMLLGEIARRHATSGPDGRFRITGLRPGACDLEAHAQTLYSHAPTIVGLGVAEQLSNVGSSSARAARSAASPSTKPVGRWPASRSPHSAAITTLRVKSARVARVNSCSMASRRVATS